MTGQGVVTDASALIKLMADEQHSSAMDEARESFARGHVPLLAPTLLPYELGHAIHRLTPEMTPEKRASVVADLLGGIQLEQPDLERVFEGADAGLTFYDASYLVLAEAHDAKLLSYDRRLLDAAVDWDVAILTPGT